MKNAMQLKAIMKKLAKENQISAQLVLQNYMLERFLERVSLSPYRDNYIIKGGFLISSMVGLNSRATMDMDATIKGYPVTQDTVQKMIEKILTVPVDDDITFTFKSIGYALVVLFFAISLCKNTMNFHELKRPEAAIHYFLRFVAAKALVGYGILNVAVRGEIAFALSATTPGRLTVCRLTGFTDIQIFLQVLLWSAAMAEKTLSV